MAKGSRDKRDGPGKSDGRRRNGWRFLQAVIRLSKLAKAITALLVATVVLLGIAFGAGPTPALLGSESGTDGASTNASSGNSAQSRGGDSNVSSNPTINVVVGSENVSICKK